MGIEKYGKCILVALGQEHKLKIGANLIAIKNGSLFLDRIVENPECLFVINIDSESAYFMSILGNVNGDVSSGHTIKLIDDMSFDIDNYICVFKYVYDEEKVEEIIDDYMNGVLSFPINMEQVFYDYAKKIKITDKKAISNVMASIDIPEIDEI